MSVLPSESKPTETRPTVRSVLIGELEKLICIAKNERLLFSNLPAVGLTKLDLMLLDSAFKEFPLERVDKTLLVLPEKYEQMLQNAIVAIIRLIKP